MRYHAFLYEARWDGPLRPEPTEISWAGWVRSPSWSSGSPTRTGWPFAPDGRAAIERWLAGTLGRLM